MDNKTDCNLHSFAGKIIGVSDQSGITGANIEHDSLLTADEVKTKVIETHPESDFKDFLEGNPQFYEFKSTIFTDLGE